MSTGCADQSLSPAKSSEPRHPGGQMHRLLRVSQMPRPLQIAVWGQRSPAWQPPKVAFGAEALIMRMTLQYNYGHAGRRHHKFPTTHQPPAASNRGGGGGNVEARLEPRVKPGVTRAGGDDGEVGCVCCLCLWAQLCARWWPTEYAVLTRAPRAARDLPRVSYQRFVAQACRRGSRA